MDEFLEIAVLGEFNDEEIEEGLEHILLNPRAVAFPRASKYERFNLDRFTDEEFIKYFRFEKEHLPRLCAGLGLPPRISAPEVRCAVTDIVGLCILLRRLSYPNRLIELEPMFGYSAEFLSIITNIVMNKIIENKGHLLNNLTNLTFLNRGRMEYYASAISRKGAPLENCWGFIDGTAKAICRPTTDQENYFSGHKRFHCVKYQSILCPDGIVVSLMGPYMGRRHDAGIYRESNIYHQLSEIATFEDKKFVIYGDPAYPIQDLILRPYPNAQLTPAEQAFNTRMSSVRQSVEWGFGKIIAQFAFLDLKKNQKLLLQDVGNIYKAAMILTNCHTCLYRSEANSYIHTDPPTLETYLGLQ